MANLVDYELQKRLCELLGVDYKQCFSLDIHMVVNQSIKFWVGFYALPSKGTVENEAEGDTEAAI